MLDRADFDDDLLEHPGTQHASLEDGDKIVSSLIRVDVLNAQRHLSDAEASGRAQSLSSRLRAFYKRNLQQPANADFGAQQALAASEDMLNQHLDTVFRPTLAQLNTLGYPGFANPHLVVRAQMDADVLLNERASVHYVLADPATTAPRPQHRLPTHRLR